MTHSKEAMLEYGYKIVDIIVDHFDTQHLKKPVSKSTREEMDKVFVEEVPESPMNAIKVLDFIKENVLNQATIVSHPKFYSFVPGPSNFISAMSDSLATGYNIFSGGWTTSAAAAELEIVTINWLLKLFKFPIKKGGGIFTSGGSMANLTAIVTARQQKFGQNFEKAVIYMSDQAHSSNIKAIRTVGFKKRYPKLYCRTFSIPRSQ